MPEERLVRSLDELPVALTVPEAAAVLRVSRSKVYDLIRLWQATGGSLGLRAVGLGRALRVPRIAVMEFLGTGLADSGVGDLRSEQSSGGGCDAT